MNKPMKEGAVPTQHHWAALFPKLNRLGCLQFALTFGATSAWSLSRLQGNPASSWSSSPQFFSLQPACALQDLVQDLSY